MAFPRNSCLAGILAATMALSLAGPAIAQGGPDRDGGRPGPGMHRDDDARESGREGGRFHGRMARQLQILDTDGDGVASQAEIAAEHARLLTAADVDGDGQLSPDEFLRRGSFFLRLGTTSFFDLLDTDGDQKISVDELNQPMERWFARRDANTDGNIDAEEFSQGRHPFARHR